jgi:RHS repeat-associated protein
VLPAQTTLYVNQCFEVRDHDQPTKYVFNGDTRVARISGSLSANTRVQRVRLDPGWNLRSLAVTAPNALHQMTNSQFSILNSESIFQWKPQSLTWLAVSPDETLPAGTVLWLHASTNTTLALTGTYTDPTNQTVAPGGTFRPGAGLESLFLPGPGAAIALWHHDAASQRWQIQAPAVPESDPGFPRFLAPGEAIFMEADASTELGIPEAALRVCYYHQDHLGSSSVMTDAHGALVEETAFYPFGASRHEHRLRGGEEHYQFTQKERDQESRLHYFGRRYYHSTLGKWLSTDPLEQQGGSLNLYAYVNQNPLKYRDPDGAEIKVAESFDKKSGTTTYRINVKAVLVDVSSKHFSPKQIQDYADKLKSTIEKSFSGQQGKSRWTTIVDLKVINDPKNRGKDDHMFRIVDRTKTGAAGTTDQIGGMQMDIAASTLLKQHPSQVDLTDPRNKHYERLYNSPESTGAHEYGHAAGLGHASSKTPNLMQEGDVREYDNRDISLDQIKDISGQAKAQNLNKQ